MSCTTRLRAHYLSTPGHSSPSRCFPTRARGSRGGRRSDASGAYAYMSPFPTASETSWGGLNKVLATHEGPIKTDTAAALATPDSLSQANRNYDAAVARAAASRNLGQALALQTPGEKSGVMPASVEMTKAGKTVHILFKTGGTATKEIEGSFVGRDGSWLVIDTASGRERIRESEVTRMVESK